MDRISPSQRSANMAKIKGRDTKPELIVRRLVHGMGYRYRLHRQDLPGKPDLVFESRKAVIFVHGCFWHRHGDPRCKNSSLPKTRTAFWEEKLRLNVARDHANQKALTLLGYRILTLWECELKNKKALVETIEEFLRTAESQNSDVGGTASPAGPQPDKDIKPKK